jgi:hypothetical protein
LSIVDAKAVDSTRAIYLFEVRLNFADGLIQRLVFYGCELFASQLSAGGKYTELKPVYSSWLLEYWDTAFLIQQGTAVVKIRAR